MTDDAHLNNWHQDAILVDSTSDKQLDLKQWIVECGHCRKKHLLVLEKNKTREIRGHMPCNHCGGWFLYIVYERTGVVKSKPSRATVKYRLGKGGLKL